MSNQITSNNKKAGTITADDYNLAEAIFKAGFNAITPDSQTQRQAFAKLFPFIYAVRNKGCSFMQITDLLRQAGFNLQLSTVKNYYSEFLQVQMDNCQKHMNEQIVVLAEMRKRKDSIQQEALSEKIIQKYAAQTASITPRVNEILGLSINTESPLHKTPTPATSNNSIKPVDIKPVSQNVPEHVTEKVDEGSFGLLNVKPSNQGTKDKVSKPTFFNGDITNTVVAGELVRKFTCTNLKHGIKPMKRRASVPDVAYEQINLEHPSIAGLILNFDQRVYGAALEYIDSDGVMFIESTEDMRFRLNWRKPIPITPSHSSGNFTEMDESLFIKK